MYESVLLILILDYYCVFLLIKLKVKSGWQVLVDRTEKWKNVSWKCAKFRLQHYYGGNRRLVSEVRSIFELIVWHQLRSNDVPTNKVLGDNSSIIKARIKLGQQVSPHVLVKISKLNCVSCHMSWSKLANRPYLMVTLTDLL